MTLSRPSSALSVLPNSLRDELLRAFETIVNNYSERRWEPAELNGGKLCEAVYSIVAGHLSGTYPQHASKPKNMVQACQDLERSYSKSPRAVRIQIPRMIIALYEIRNNRGVGHTGGEVNPNEMDATAVLYMSKWLLAELVRLLHSISVDEAAEIVEAIVERQTALVWSSGGLRRVLQDNLTFEEKVLILMVGVDNASDADLIRWTEHKRPAEFKRRVLSRMHDGRLIEYAQDEGTVLILPPGVTKAEQLIAKLAN